MKKNLALLPIAALAATFVFTACGEETPAKVVHKADAAPSASTDPNGIVQDSDPSADADADAEEASDDTATIGDTVEVGAWNVKVTKVILNANEAIHKANEFNEKPKGQYVLVTYEASYNGTERTADTEADITWNFTTTDSQVHDEAAEVTQADNEEWPTEARKGGTVKQQVVFDLAPGKIKGGTLSVQGYTDDFDEVYADFAI